MPFFRHFLSSLFGKLRHLVMVLHASMPRPKWSKMVKKIAKIRFRPYTFIIRGLDFFLILLTVRGGAGGVNPYGQADRIMDVFVFDDFPKDISVKKNPYSTVSLTVRGGGRGVTPPA